MMLALALALTMQDQTIEPTPGRCIAAIDRFGPTILPSLRHKIEEAQKVADSGGTPEYDERQRKAFLEMLARDEAAYATTIKRYRGVTPSQDDVAAVAAIPKGSEILALIRKCGEPE